MAFGKNLVTWLGSEVIRFVAWAACSILAFLILLYGATALGATGYTLLGVLLFFLYPTYKLLRIPFDRFIEQVLLNK